MEAGNYRGHVVCIPSPFQSHIKGMHKLAKLLHHKGFYITFVNTEFNHRRYLKSRSTSGHNSLDDDGFPSFQFETIPDGLPAPSNENANQDAESLFESISNNVMLPPFLDLLRRLSNTAGAASDSNTAVIISCVISDGFMPFTVTAAQELGIPIAFFYTIAACSLKEVVPLREENLSPAIKDSNNPIIRVAIGAANNITKASAILIHTYDALEGPVLDALSAKFPNIFTIGPLQLLLNQIEEQEAAGGGLNSIGYNLWKEEAECLQWLDSKELPNSVIYVNFGGSIFLTEQQLIEVAMGLVDSNHPFLWIIRPDLVTGDTSDLPYEFRVKAKERSGFIASWCPQEKVLNHKSVGGYFTHSGWNSTIESLSSGVPMMCWPFKGDQPTNCRYTCNEWGVGMEIVNGEDGRVSRREVEKLVRELMEGEKGKQMRNKAMEWKRLAEEAAAPNGSSSTSLENLVNDVLLSKDHMHCSDLS